MAKTPTPGNTFDPVVFDPQKFANLPFADYVTALLETPGRVRKDRHDFFVGKRKENSEWANETRARLARLGAAAFLLTSVATAFSLFNSEYQKYILLAVTAILCRDGHHHLL